MSEANHTATDKNIGLSTFAFLLSMLFIGAAIVGGFVLIKILFGLIDQISNGYSFLTLSVVYHIVWLCLIISLLIAGISLVRSALTRRTKNLIPGITLYVLGAALVIIGLFYITFQQFIFAGIFIVIGAICIYMETATEVA